MKRLQTMWPRFALILAGVGVGLLARYVIGPPEENNNPKLEIDRPLVDTDEEPGPAILPVDVPLD